MNIKKILLGFVILICYQMGFAQQGINYKALIKDANGNPLATFMNVQFTIHSTTETGTIVYQEDHNYTTDANGLLILTIGTDPSPSVGVFEDIEWSADLHFLNTTVTYDATGAIDLGTTQFRAVPYAIHATTATTATTSLDAGASSINGLSDGKSDANGSSLFLGLEAGANDDSSDNKNVGLGYQALNNNITGSGNVALGYQAGVSETGSNKLYIANSNTTTPLIYGEFDTEKLTINGELKVNANTVSAVQLTNTTTGSTSNDGLKMQMIGFSGSILNKEAGQLSLGSGNLFSVFISPNGSLGLNTTTMIGQADFTIRSRSNYFGGMFIDSPNLNGDGKPFYGYSLNGQVKAYNFYDAIDDTWKFQFSGTVLEHFSISQNGSITAPNFDLAEITDNKALITKEYADTNLGGSGLEALDEGNGIGWRFKGRDPANYDDIGENAVDLSTSTSSSTTRGASGISSTAMGSSTTASGSTSTAMGLLTTASGSRSTAMGRKTVASGVSSTAMGESTNASASGSTSMGLFTTASGFSSTAMGYNTNAPSYAETAIGRYNTIYTPNDDNSWNANDRLFVVGNGANSLNKSDAFTILKNGFTTIHNNTQIFGNLFVSGVVIQNSDHRLKKDIEALPYGLKEILQLQPKAYNWKDKKQAHKSLGLIAQDVQPLIKEIVMAQDDDAKTLGVSYTELIPVLINAIKEQQTVIESEKLKVTTLETQVNKQQADISELKTMVQQLLVKDETALLEKR